MDIVSTNKTPWCIRTPEGVKYLTTPEYLDHLVIKAQDIKKSGDKQRMKFLYWDFDELQQEKLSPFYDFTIKSQISSLKRILKCIPIKDYRPNVYINIEDD